MRPLDPDLEPGRPRSVTARRHGRRRTASERRSDHRFPIANTEIRNHKVKGRVVDLNRSGMAIESDAALGPGRRYGLTLSIGAHVETLDVRVLWCRLTATRRKPNGDVVPVYRAGIQRIRP